MQCPKCGSGVTAEAKSCPICFADMDEVGRQQGPAGFQMPTASVPREEEYMPIVGIPGLDNVRLPEAPPPNYLSPGIGSAPAMGGGEVRVSLTGEVLEVATPTPKNMPGPGGMSPPGVRPPMGARPGPPRPMSAPRAMSRREEDDDILPRQKAGPMAAIVLVLLILGGGAYGGWYWYNNRTNPKDQAVKFGTAIKTKNWGDVFDLCAWPPDKVSRVSRSDFAAGVEKGFNQASSAVGPEMAELVKQVLGSIEASGGEPTINGDKADVPMTNKVSAMGMTISLNGTAHMIRQGGIWKLDMTNVDPNDPQSFQTAFQEYMGKPQGGGNMGGMGGGGMGGGGGGMRRR